jgi:hypothetical protein
MKYAFYGNLQIGEIDTSLAASPTNLFAQVRKTFNPGCEETLEIDSKSDVFESYNGCTGIELLAFSRTKRRTSSLKASFSDATLQGLRAFMSGTDMAADVSAVTVTSRTLNSATGAAVYALGDYAGLGVMNILALSLTGNAIALVAGTDYELDPVFGTIRWLANITGPVVAASFTYQNPRGTALFNAAQKDYVVMMNGYNADGGAPGQFAGYKVKLALDGTFALYTTEQSTINCSGAMQADSNKAAGGLLGQLGFIRGFGLPAYV